VPVSDSSPSLYLAALGDLEVVIDGRGKPGAAEVEKARGDWLTVRAVMNRHAVTE